jgi:hypothetical protein
MQCRIRIKGHLDPFWQKWFAQLEIVQEEKGTTLLCGYLEDQAALYHVLLRIRNLGLALIVLETNE